MFLLALYVDDTYCSREQWMAYVRLPGLGSAIEMEDS
jgi:hypothetical protein